MSQFDNVSVVKEANVYFDGKCVSHSIIMPDGTRKSVGVILPSKLLFSTAAPEIMEILAGVCQVTRQGETAAETYKAGDRFTIPGESSFQIDVSETVHYVCHFG